MKIWTDFKKPKTFEESVEFLRYCKERGFDCAWSIQYWGYGEHFTFWPGDGTFTDFLIDRGTAIDWKKMENIIIESAQTMWQHLKNDCPHLFRKDSYRELFLRKPQGKPPTIKRKKDFWDKFFE